MTDTRAALMAEARLNLSKLAQYPQPEPSSIDEAIELQDSMVAELRDNVVGWKIGCTSETAQKMLGADEPFFGALISGRVFDSGAHVTTSDTAIRVVETEVALKLSEPIVPRPSAYSTADVMTHVGSVHPAIEIVDRRLPGGLSDGLYWNIADCGVNDALVLGAPCAPSSIRDYAGVTARVFVDGEEAYLGTGANALGGADRVLTWFANRFSELGRTIPVGAIVSTGLITDVFTVDKDTAVRAEFDELGTVAVRL